CCCNRPGRESALTAEGRGAARTDVETCDGYLPSRPAVRKRHVRTWRGALSPPGRDARLSRMVVAAREEPRLLDAMGADLAGRRSEPRELSPSYPPPLGGDGAGRSLFAPF